MKILELFSGTGSIGRVAQRLGHEVVSLDPEEKKNYKKEKGQFNTTNSDYILQNMELVDTPEIIIDPCCGDKDLIKYILKKCNGLWKPKQVAPTKTYDVDPEKECITQDTLEKPVDYSGALLMMNPPYLSNVQNKSKKNKAMYKKYKKDDLFKCYIQTMLDKPPKEFMIIVPLNFLCSIRKADQELRKNFLRTFDIILINIFNEKVFSDTTYTVCSIHGILKKNKKENYSISAHIYPKPAKKITLTFSEKTNYLLGGEIYNLDQSTYKIGRAVGKTPKDLSNLYLKTIDDGIDPGNTKINMSVKKHPQPGGKSFGKISDRSYAWITIKPSITKEQQKQIAYLFNSRLETWREKYDSLFLTNFRDKGRKRISFSLAFQIISNILLEEEHVQNFIN